MHELPPHPDDLLALARQAQGEPDAEIRARVRRGVAGALVAGAAVSLTGAAGARAAVKGGWSGALAAKLAAGAAVCALALGVFLSSRAERGPRVEPNVAVGAAADGAATAQRAPSPTPSEEVPTVEVVASSVSIAREEVPPAPTRTETLKRKQHASSAATPSLRAELMLLEQAERAIDRDDPRRALTLLERHRARFVTSSFGQEREGLSLIARCMVERAPAVAEATHFLSQAVGAVLHDRVRTACLVPP